MNINGSDIPTIKEGIMLYEFNISSENKIKITAPTEEDAWDRLWEVVDTPLPSNVTNITCACTGEE